MDTRLGAIAIEVKHFYSRWPLDDSLIISINTDIFALKCPGRQTNPTTCLLLQRNHADNKNTAVTRVLSLSTISLRKEPPIFPVPTAVFVRYWHTINAPGPNWASEDSSSFPQSGNGPGWARGSLAESSKGTISQAFCFKGWKQGKEHKLTASVYHPPTESLPEMKPAVGGKLKPRDKAKYTRAWWCCLNFWVQPHLRPLWLLVLTVSLTQSIVTWEQKASHWETT